MAIQEFDFSNAEEKVKAERLFDKASDKLEGRAPELAASLFMKGGKVYYITEDQNVFAGAFYDTEKKESALLINSPQWSNLQEEEATTVLAHEALHFYLDHHTWFCPDPELDRLYGYAADIVINDYLLENSFVLPEGAVSGSRIFGINCAYHSIEKVFEVLLSLSGYIRMGKDKVQEVLCSNDTPQSINIKQATIVLPAL